MCQRLSEITGIPWGKDLDIESREMGQSGTDVKLRGQAKELLKLDIECKAQESWSVHGWVEQAIFNWDGDNDWVVVCKRSRKKPVVIIDLDFFIRLMRIVVDYRRRNKMKLLIKARKKSAGTSIKLNRRE